MPDLNIDPTIMIIAVVVLLGGMMFFQQWQSRRQQKKQMEGMNVGGQVMTVGGIIGTLTHLDTEEKRARIEIAPGVEIEVVLEAIGRTLVPSEEPEQDEEEEEIDEADEES